MARDHTKLRFFALADALPDGTQPIIDDYSIVIRGLQALILKISEPIDR